MSYPKNNLTYRNIISDFEQAASESIAVATFDTGTIDFLDANAVNKNYPYLYLRPISSQGVVDKVKSLSFELYSMDVPTLADQSPVRVLSETEQRIYDTIAWFNFGPASRQQVYEIDMTDLSPVNEAFQDRVFGWVATIQVTTPFNWNYCDYPKVWPTPTATIQPTSTPTPSPTLFPPTPTPTGPTPTPTTSPTPTPSPTSTSTPTPTPTSSPTPLPTFAPTPTPSPTPAPLFFEFKIDGTNQTGSLELACDLASGSFSSVYVDFNDSDPAWPDRIVGKTVWSNQALTNVYTGSAVIDDSVVRLAYGSESVSATPSYAAIDLRWYNATGSNIVDTLVPCAFPIIETNDATPLTVSSSLLSGQVDNFAGRTFDQVGFQWSTGSSSDNMLEGNAITSSTLSNPWTYPLETDVNVTNYYRAWVRDDESGAVYFGDIETLAPVTAYAWPVIYQEAISGFGTNLQTEIDRIQSFLDNECQQSIPSPDTMYAAVTFQTGSATAPYGCDRDISEFVGASLWDDQAMTIPAGQIGNTGFYTTHAADIHGLPSKNSFFIVNKEVSGVPNTTMAYAQECVPPNSCDP